MCYKLFLRAPQWGWVPLAHSGHWFPNAFITHFFPSCPVFLTPVLMFQFCFWEGPKKRHYPNTMLYVSNSTLWHGPFSLSKTHFFVHIHLVKLTHPSGLKASLIPTDNLSQSPRKNSTHSRTVYLSTACFSRSHMRTCTCVFTPTTIQGLNNELLEGRCPVIFIFTATRTVLSCDRHSLNVC